MKTHATGAAGKLPARSLELCLLVLLASPFTPWPSAQAQTNLWANAAPAELAAAKARYDWAFTNYTRLATEGGTGDITQALAEYRAAYAALQALQARSAASPPPSAAPAQPAPLATAPVAAPARPTPAAATAAAPAAAGATAPAAPFTGFKTGELAAQAQLRDSRLPWSAQATTAQPAQAGQLAAYGGTLSEARNRLQVVLGKAPTQTLNNFEAIWAPLYAYPTAQNQAYFQRLVPTLDDYITAGVEVEQLAPSFRDSLTDLAIAAASGNDHATRTALRAAGAQAVALQQSRQKLLAAAQRVWQLGDPQNPLAAQQAARQQHLSAVRAKPAAAPPPAAAPAPAQPCTNPYGDCPVTNVRIVSTAPDAGTSAMALPNVPIQPAPRVSGPPTSVASVHAPSAGPTAPATEAAVQAEAIAQHLEIARQREDSARRWDADAQREKDPVRKKELQDRAEFERDMAQAERDLASSLQTGVIVHTRTPWQDQQAAALIGSMKAELAEFDKDHQRIEALPKLAAMVSGPEGQRLQAEIHQRIREALAAPDRGAKLEQLHTQLKRVVTSQRDAELGQQQAHVAQAEANLATVEGIKAGADAAFWAATWLVPGGGTVSMAYGAGVGYAEGGIVGAVATSARAYSDVLDIGLAAVNGALEVDDAGQRRGVGGALQAGLSTAVLNKLTNALAGKTTGFVQGAIGRARPVKAPVGEGPRPEAFKDNHERYADALKAASTPAQRQAVAQQFRVVAAREQLRSELADVTRRHEQAIPLTARGPDGSIDTTSRAYAQQKQAWERDMAAVRAKYAPQENRSSIHAQAMADAALGSAAVPLSGGPPKSVMSDMDVSPIDHASGQKYVQALRKGGRQVLDFPDRWIAPDLDLTIWKPGHGGDKPGSSSYEAAIAHDAMFGSDKFPTQGGVEYTTRDGVTADAEGAVIANAKKAVEAGMGKASGDLHVVGKSLDKAMTIAGVAGDPALMARAKAVREHQTAVEAGITTFGASPAQKARDEARFLAQTRAAFAEAMHASGQKSADAATVLKGQLAEAQARRDKPTADKLRDQLARYKISNQITLQSLASRDPGTVAAVLARRNEVPPSNHGYGWLTDELARDRQALERQTQAAATVIKLPGVGERCRSAATQVAGRLAALPTKSPEAAYLTKLKVALERGASDPGLAVSEVRLLSGYELSEVLRDLGSR